MLCMRVKELQVLLNGQIVEIIYNIWNYWHTDFICCDRNDTKFDQCCVHDLLELYIQNKTGRFYICRDHLDCIAKGHFMVLIRHCRIPVRILEITPILWKDSFK